MKHIFLKSLLGLSLFFSCLFVVFAEPIPDSGNVTYGDFVPMYDSQCGTTELTTGILEYIVTFPKKTDIVPYKATSRYLGPLKVEGKSFIKPYKVAVTVSKKDFKLTTKKAKNKSDTIKYDVTEMITGEDGKKYNGESILNKTLYFYENDLSDIAGEGDPYMDGEFADINHSVDVGIKIEKSEWTNASPGKYKGKITFYAELDDTDIWQ